jgi:hypothetical protein
MPRLDHAPRLRQCSRRKPARPPHGVARLTLHINGVTYNVRPIACDPTAALQAFRLRKADGTAYHVALTPDGLTCDCPDFTWHRNGDGVDDCCKHIKAMIAVGMLRARQGQEVAR